MALFDLAWPNGIQEELSQPVAVLLNEGAKTIATASQAGYRCFSEFVTEVRSRPARGRSPDRLSPLQKVVFSV
jgi:hypothetical protein